MLKRSLISSAAMLVLAAAIGCEQDMSDLGGKPSPSIPIGESHFMKVMANANQAEISRAKIALSRSHNEKVRQFAQNEVEEHTQMQTQLQQLASAKEAVLPKVMGNIEEGSVANLSSQPDDKFDASYIQSEITSHQDAINNTQAEATNGADVDVKHFAQNILPTLEHHEVLAKQLQGN